MQPKLLHHALRSEVLAMRDADDSLHPLGLEAKAQSCRTALRGESPAPGRAPQRPPHLRVVVRRGPVRVVKQTDAADQPAAGALFDSPQPKSTLLPMVLEPQQLLPRSFQVERPQVADHLGIGVDRRHSLRVTRAPTTQSKPWRLDLRYLHLPRPMLTPSARRARLAQPRPPGRSAPPTTRLSARPRRTSPRRSPAAAGSRASARRGRPG